MKFKKQQTCLSIKNFDNLISDQKTTKNKHGNLLPNSIRAIIIGPSNSGKTNALLSLIVDPNGLKFENVYVYSKSLNQPKYKFLEQLITSIQGLKYFPFEAHEQVITPEKALPNSLMIFDDIACEKQDSVRSFFCRGRHQDVDCFYLSQTYSRNPKHLIRDNTNFFIIFKQDETNLKHVYYGIT